MADAQTQAICRTYIALAGQQSAIYATESYQDILDRVNAARESTLTFSAESMGNPLSLPLVNVRMLVHVEDEQAVVVDACFNPMHLVMMYRAHPNV